MKSWMTAMSILGFLFGIASGIVVTASGAAFGNQEMGSDGASVFWLSFLILALGFLAWIPKRWLRIVCGAGMVFLAGYGLWNNGLFFLLAAAFTLIAGVLMFGLKPEPPVMT